MNRPDTREDYSRRIQRAIVHIAGNLDQEMSLDQLAAVACFSPYHFHRIYRGMAGETVVDTVRRLRLHRAGVDLIQTNLPIAAVARRAGYGSVAAFTRAFRGAYRDSPAAYRLARRSKTLESPQSQETSEMHEVTITSLPELRVAAIRHTGAYDDIGVCFDRLFAWAAGRGLIASGRMEAGFRSFGIYHDDPRSVPVEHLRSDACMTVGPDVMDDGDVRILTVPAGPAAMLIHVGPYAELERSYVWLYGTWLPSSGLEPADRPCLEEYLNDCRVLPPAEWRTAIYLPLKSVADQKAA